MGLFGKKEICPICGQPVKGIVHVKIKDKVSLCQDCSSKIAMEQSMLPFQTAESIKEHLLYREKNKNTFDKFTPTNEVKCGTAYFREDSNMKKWYYTLMKKPINPSLFNYDEIVDYELTEDGEQIAKGGLGSAVAGGILLGGVGAVVGSNIGKKKTKTIVKSMKLRISLNNKYTNQILIELIPFGTDVKAGSLTYNMYKSEANNIISFLDGLCSKASIESSNAPTETPVGSDADEILKFKQLLDSGIITQEEFDAKKKQLLGL